MYKKRISKVHIASLEKAIEDFESKIDKKSCFCLSGDNFCSSALDVARTITRRSERRVTTLKRKKSLKNNQILVYLNRLSDLLYVLARFCEKKPKK